MELSHINENYVAHGICGKCGGVSNHKLTIDLTFDNLSIGHMDKQFQLLLRKAVYPYEYMNYWEKFKENHLPPIKVFYSKLNLSGISERNYNHMQIVWREAGMKNLGYHHDLYLKTDVLLLCNVFKTFRTTCLEHYALDPAHFYTSPELAWKACLQLTGINLELLTDANMLLMFEQGTRGGITQAVHQYVRGNNKYMDDRFEHTEENCHLQYLDSDNLCDWIMSQSLLTGRFKWVSNQEKLNPTLPGLLKTRWTWGGGFRPRPSSLVFNCRSIKFGR